MRRTGKAALAVAGAALLSASILQMVQADPLPRFRNVTEQVGLSTLPTISWGSVFADYDRSGYPDVFVNRHFWRPWLYQNLGDKRFALHTEDFSPRRVDRHNCAWGEATGNRRVDLFCATGALRGKGRDPNQLFVQRRDGGFRNRARAYRLRYGKARARTANWLDYDGDGDLDVFVTTAPREGFPNALFRNDGGRFTRANAGAEDGLRSSSSSWADWDRNGRPDILVTQHIGPPVAYVNRDGRFEKVDLPGVTDRRGRWLSAAWGDFDGDGWPDVHLVGLRRAVILRNNQGRFNPVHQMRLLRGRMSVWFDHDNDGRLDLYVVQGAFSRDADSINHPNFLLVQLADGTFETVMENTVRGPRSGNGDSAAAADFDRDGRVDLFVSNGHRPRRWRGPSLLLRNITDAGNWLAIDLRGPRGNPWGFGARVSVQSDGASYERQITDGVASRTQSEVGHVHLGIANSSTAVVRVEWPDGVSDCRTLEANRSVSLRHGSNPC
jgi:hypothetical protein